MQEGIVASVHHDEPYGTAAAGGHEESPLQQFAEDCGIDTQKYYPVGIAIHGPELQVSMLAVRTSTMGRTELAIREHARELGKLPVSTLTTDKTLPRLSRHLRRFEVILTSELVSGLAVQNIHATITEPLP